MSRAGLAVMASKYDKNLFFGTLYNTGLGIEIVMEG